MTAGNGRAHPLVRQMFDIMREQRTCLVKMAGKAGIAGCNLRSWRRGACPRVAYLDACLQALGYELRIVKVTGTAIEDRGQES